MKVSKRMLLCAQLNLYYLKKKAKLLSSKEAEVLISGQDKKIVSR